MTMHQTTETHDLIVVGSGGGGLATAVRAHDLGLSVLVIEKSDMFGGTTATSGGGIWVPASADALSRGAKDSIEDALAYCMGAIGESASESKLRAYLERADGVVQYLAAHTPVRYRAVAGFPDYYSTVAGARDELRTMEPDAISASRLRGAQALLRPPIPSTMLLGRYAMMQVEARTLFSRSKGWKALAAKLMYRYWLDLAGRLKGPRDRRLTMGSALAGGLLLALRERGVELRANTQLVRLRHEGDRVVGLEVERSGTRSFLRARHGVVLAAGGFERSPELRKRFLKQPSDPRWSATPPFNTGDALKAAMDIGAQVEGTDWLWGVPTVAVPGTDRQTPVFAERSLPGNVIVNNSGCRFINEAEPYLEFVAAMLRMQEETGSGAPCWFVFDAQFRKKYPIGPIMPVSIMPDSRLPKDWLGNVLHRADTLADLAREIGVDAANLQMTVDRMNGFARAGVDTQFGKGNSPIDRFWGDADVSPNPCLAPIDTGPFYAVRLDAGDIGTQGGLVTGVDAQVIGAKGGPIEGLYAIGNTAASVMRGRYPGPGATIGPALVFGFRAAEHAARRGNAELRDGREAKAFA